MSENGNDLFVYLKNKWELFAVFVLCYCLYIGNSVVLGIAGHAGTNWIHITQDRD